MTPAAFQAAFSDFKLIKGRKCAQIILEVPIEGADAALAALGGLPRPDQEAWVAVARIDPKAVSEAPNVGTAGKIITGLKEAIDHATSAPARRAWNDLPAVQQAGIRCNEKAFWKFLEFEAGGIPVSCEDGAARVVRDRCRVQSRSELLLGSHAERRWQFIEATYQNWLANERYSEAAR